MLRAVLLAKSWGEFRFGVSNAMTFIDYNILPIKLAEGRLVIEDVFICGEHDMEFLIFQELSQSWSLIFLSFISDHPDGRCPLLELCDPVLYCDQRDHNQEWTFVTLVTDQVWEQTNRLDSFTQAHFVCKDSIQVVIIERNHPIQTHELVRFEQAASQQMGLRFNRFFDRVRDVIIDLRTVLKIVFDLRCVTLVVAVIIVTDFIIFFYFVPKGINSIFVIFNFFPFVSSILLLKHHFGAKLLQKFVSLF